MKKKLSILSILLALALLFTSLPLTAGADSEPPEELARGSGPLLPDSTEYAEFAAQFTFLQLIELNEDGTSKQDEESNFIGYTMFRNGWDEEKGWFVYSDEELPSGVAYDLQTNTLTLTDFDGSKYLLSANMMGDDLKLRVEGDVKLGRITVWGDGWGAGLEITGTGTLTVDENKLFDAAIDFYPEGAWATLRVDKDATVKLYGKKNAVRINGTTQTEDLFDLPDGAKAEPAKENYVQNMSKWLFGYTIDDEYMYTSNWTQAVCKDDPDGIYTIGVSTYYPDGPENEETAYDMVDVKHYYYFEKYDYYLEDYEFGDEDGSTDRSFADYEAAKAAGFEPKLDENGEPVSIEMKTGGGSGSYEVVIGPDGKEYVGAWTKKGDGDYGDVLAEIEPLPGVEDVYLFVVRRDLIDIDPETLESVKIDVEYDDLFAYSIPGEEFVYEAAAPVTEPPTTEAPKTEAPTTEAPTTEAPTTEAPTADEPGEGFTLGDVNMDGKIKSSDARLALRAAAKVEPLSELQMKLADVNEDGKVKAGDARLILRIGAKLDPAPEKMIAG